MGYEQKPNTGVMFNNDRKESDKHPDRKGEALIDGKPYWVAGWIKQGKNGSFLSLAFTPKDAKPKRDRGRAEDMEEDIPW